MRWLIDRFFAPLIHQLRRQGSPLLMWILVGIILCSPLADSHRRIGAALSMAVLLIVLTGASFTGNRKVVLYTGVPLAGVWVVARLLEEFGSGQHVYNHMAHAAGLTLSCVILWGLFDRLRGTPLVTSSVLAEAVMIYLIIAIAFSQLYWIISEYVTRPFSPAIPASDSATLLYFSMITLTSVGYGEIIPLNPFVRMIAAFESMTGIFYIAMVVARLVSAYRREED